MENTKIGYVRCSATDQNPERQIEKMRELGVSDRFLFIEKASGRTMDRPVYNVMKSTLREGDLLYLDSLDRLGRNYDGILKEWKCLTRELGVDVVALDKADLFDSRKFKQMGDIGKLLEDQMLSMMAYVAEQELKKNHQRQREGIEIAKREGKYKGRKPIEVDWEEFGKQYTKRKNGLTTHTIIQKEMGLKPATYYKKLAEYEQMIGVKPTGEG